MAQQTFFIDPIDDDGNVCHSIWVAKKDPMPKVAFSVGSDGVMKGDVTAKVKEEGGNFTLSGLELEVGRT
jgi:hypothetical protein